MSWEYKDGKHDELMMLMMLMMMKRVPFEWLHERIEHLDIYFLPPVTQWHSISDVLFTGGSGVSDFSVLKYY